MNAGSDCEAPLVSVITVTKNAALYLEQSLLSVITQSYPKIEHIILDGLSDDSTVDIIKKYENDIAYWSSEPDGSMYEAINKAIQKSKGDIVAILNADDRYVDAGVVSKIVDALKPQDVDGVYGDLIVDYGGVKKYKKVFQVTFDEYLLSGKGTFIPHITLFLKRRCLDNVGLYNLGYRYASDYDFTLRCLNACNLKYIPMPVSIFRRHAGSITASGKIKSERDDILRSYGYFDHHKMIRGMSRVRLWGRYYLENVIKRISRDARSLT